MEMITLCGDDCRYCPRYNAKTEEELAAAAELWYKVGWRDRVTAPEEMLCEGCHTHKKCTYRIAECVGEHGIEKCSKCGDFPCEKISLMLVKSMEYREKAFEVCNEEEFGSLERAFFNKEENLKK